MFRVPRDKQNLKMLLAGRNEIFPNELLTGYEFIRKHFTLEQIQMFTHHPKPVKADPVPLLFSKKIK